MAIPTWCRQDVELDANDQFGIINHLLMSLGSSMLPGRGRRPDLLIAASSWSTSGRPRRSWRCSCWQRCRCCPRSYEAAQIDGVHPVKVFFR